MKIRDTGLHFGAVTIGCHWIGALLMVAFIAGAFWTLGSAAENIMMRRDLVMGLGLVTALLHAFRLYWRLANYHPAPLGGANPAQVLVGRGVALGMLLAGVVLPILFWAKEAGSGASIKAFTLPMPTYQAASPLIMATLFWLGVVAFLFGLVLHLFGAYTHQVILKDESLKRLSGGSIQL